MKLPRQPEIVSITVTCPHKGDGEAAAELVSQYLKGRFDHIQCWEMDDSTHIIKCYPRVVND